MSWPGEEWKAGLPARALRAIAEAEQRLERLQKERQQKQVQLDTLEALMHKQKQKHEEERASWALLSQQNRSLAESCDQSERARQRLAQELQAKDAQLSCLEAQLAQATRRQTELEEELRRCQAELDGLQSRSPLVLLPPRWGSPTPWAEGSIETKAETSRSFAAGPSPSRSCPPLRGAGRRDPPTTCWQREAACPSAPPGSPVPTENGESVRPVASEPASANERLKEDNRELRLALDKTETLRLEKEKELQQLRGELELTRVELAQCKKHRGDQAETDPRHCRGRRLSEDVSRSRTQQKGLLERLPAGGGHRSISSSRQEQSEEKKGATTKGKGPRVQSNDGSRDELQVLKAEVLVLQQRLQTSENKRKSLLETSLRYLERESQIGDQEKQVLPSVQPEKREFSPDGEAVGKGEDPGKVETDGEVPPLGAEGDLAKRPDLHRTTGPKGDLEALQGELRFLASRKAEAEAEARLSQQKLQSLQAMLGNQTERLAQAMETQKRHVEELLADGEEKDRLLKNLSRELEETRKELDVASAERRRLQALLRSGEGVPCGTEAAELSEPSRGTRAVETPKGNPPVWIPKDETGHPQEEVLKQLEVSVAQLTQENQALRQELARSQAGRGGGDDATVDVPPEVACLGEVPEAAQKRESLLKGSSRNAQTQTDPEGSHRRRERVSVAFDDTQYEPYGLPEVVMKGFADIPSGPSCPYVLRRGILGSAPVAQLAPRAEPEEDSPEAEEGTGV